MNTSVILQYPYWFIIFCIALGLIYATVLYFKNNTLNDATIQQKNIFKLLAVFRFLAVSIIAFFLLSPFIRSRFTDTQKPKIVILQDVSQSVKNTFKTTIDSVNYYKKLQQFINNFNDDYDVNTLGFSNKPYNTDTLLFNGKSTNIAKALEEVNNLYSNQNVGAIVLATDGIYNEGINPLYSISNNKFPIYTIALGDTNSKKDIKVEKVYFNQIVYLGDKFKIAVDAVSTGFNDINTSISILDVANKKKIIEESILLPKESLNNKEFVLEADKPGVLHYRVQLNSIKNEFTISNNYKDFFIEVLDSRQKILIAASSPHPDIAALKQAIENNKNYHVDLKWQQELPGINLNEYNVVILHQLPNNTIQQNVLESINKAKTSLWYINGSQTNIGLLNKWQSAIQIAGFNQSNNDVYASVNNDFSLYNISEVTAATILKMPPLSAPFGQYKNQPTSKVLLKQKIGSVKTEYPLLAFDDKEEKKVAVLCAEGLWRWRLYDFQQNKNHDFTNQFIQQIIQYLAVKEDKRPFKINLPKNIFNENEPVTFEAELYNKSYQLVNESIVSLIIKDANSKKTFNYEFSRSGNGYRAEIDNLPTGNYTFTASSKLNEQPYTFSGKFTVAPLQLENLSSIANHQLLYQISNETGGKLFYPNQFESLSKTIADNQNIKPLLYDTFKTDAIINKKWIFFLIIALLSFEWFIRKYLGAY